MSQEKFVQGLDLLTILNLYKPEIERACGVQFPLVGTLANSESESSWVIQNVGSSYILLRNKSIVDSEEDLKRIQNENLLSLINEVFFQLEAGEQNLQMLDEKIVEFNIRLEKIKSRFAENLGRLKLKKMEDAIRLILVQNCIKEMEEFSFDLDQTLKESHKFIIRNQEIINKCCEHIFTFMQLIDATLSNKLKQINDETEKTLRENIFQFNEALSIEKELSEIIVIPDKRNLSEQDVDSIRVDKEVLFIEKELFKIVVIPAKRDLPEQDIDSIQLHEVKEINQYVWFITLALKEKEKAEKSLKLLSTQEEKKKILTLLKKSIKKLLEELINYREARLAAIGLLIEQLALSLALEEPEEKIALLYHWIEICRGKSPEKRTVIPGLLDQEALNTIYQDPVLNKIYFELPRILQADLSCKAEHRAKESTVINSVWSIDDPTLNLDQILLQLSRFIAQERDRFPRGSRPKSLELMTQLYQEFEYFQNEAIEKIDDETINGCKIAYKIYQAEQGIPSEKRLLTQEPLTEKEYQFIQIDPSFLEVFKNLTDSLKDELREEQYKSILLDVFAGPRERCNLLLMSDLPARGPEEGKMYLEKQGDSLKYIVITPKGEPISDVLDIIVDDLTKESLVLYRDVILNETSKRGHTPEKRRSPINIHGFLEHDKDAVAGLLFEAGEAEFLRGFRFLINGELFQYKIKYGVSQTLVNILMEKGFSQNEANSTVCFISNQRAYYIFYNLLALCGKSAEKKDYATKEMQEYINIYKSDDTVYFDVKSGPWRVMCRDDTGISPDGMLFFPDQPIQINQERRTIKRIGKDFYNAELTWRYKLIIGKKITDDVLQLIMVKPDNEDSWQLLTFRNPDQNWNALTTIQRFIIDIELVIKELYASEQQKRQDAKIKIDLWLSDEPNELHLDDYKLIQSHLQAISEDLYSSLSIGADWLKKALGRCAQKVKTHGQQQSKSDGKEQELLPSPDKPIVTEIDTAMGGPSESKAGGISSFSWARTAPSGEKTSFFPSSRSSMKHTNPLSEYSLEHQEFHFFSNIPQRPAKLRDNDNGIDLSGNQEQSSPNPI